MYPFYTPWKHQKAKGILVFLGCIKWEHWLEMGKAIDLIINFQKELLTGVTLNDCSEKNHKNHKKTPGMETFFSKVASQRLLHY